jgi:glycosyltransferase involved in cell wall biosynthesis
LAQTYKDIELILVDDGSPDRCPQICDEYAAKDSRITVIHQKNSGVSAARNAGLAVAKGEYIGFVDPDDWIAPDMYAGMLMAIEREQVELAICGYDYYDETGKLDEKRCYPVRNDETITQKEVMNRFADMPPSIRHGVWNKLFKNNLFHGQTFKEGLHSSEDVFFMNEYVRKISRAVVVHKPYYKNLVRQGSATHGGLSIPSLSDSFAAHDQMYRDAVRLYPELKNHCLAFLLDVCTLKYNEAQRKLTDLQDSQKTEAEKRLHRMKKYIRHHAVQGLLDREIYWKTRIMYLVMK